MLKSFFSRPNVLVRLLVVLIFASGLVFAATYDGFVVKTEAESCACSGMDTASANKPIEQPEAEASGGCCGSATDTLLAETTTAQPEINHGTEEPTHRLRQVPVVLTIILVRETLLVVIMDAALLTSVQTLVSVSLAAVETKIKVSVVSTVVVVVNLNVALRS